MPHGIFITLEGVDGAGKSTHLRKLVEYLRTRPTPVLVTREPGGTKAGERIRNLLLRPGTAKMSAMTELILMYAAREQHLEEVVRPALARGRIVISDRYNDASFAYQGYGRLLGPRTVRTFDRAVCGRTQPDLTLLLDIDPRVALERAHRRSSRGRTKLTRFENHGLKFQKRVRAGYLALAKQEPRRMKVISADRPAAEVQAEIRKLVDALLAKRSRLRSTAGRARPANTTRRG